MHTKLSPEERRKRLREGAVIVLSLILIVFLTVAEIRLSQMGSDSPLGSNVVLFGLINIVILLVVLLVYLITRNVLKLFLESRANPLGTRLKTRLVISFVGLSLIPTMLLFFASASFISNSVQNWFNTRIETSLSESLEVAQTYYKNSAENAISYGRQISGAIQRDRLLNEENIPRLKEFVRKKQAEYNLGVVEVYSSQKEELFRAANSSIPIGEFTTPESVDIKRAFSGEELTKVNQAGKADLIRGIVPIRSTWNQSDVVGVVVVNYFVPNSLVSKMKEITSSYHEFRQLKILKNPITTGYILTLFLITAFIIFLSVWTGLYLANSMTKPVQELADATRRVAAGNLDVHIESRSSDEIGMLVSSFNRMTDDLRNKQLEIEQSSTALHCSNFELEQRRRYMETVLKNVAAGVIATDRIGEITTINRSAEKLLGINTGTLLGRNFKDVLKEAHLDFVRDTLKELVASRQNTINRQIQLEIRGNRVTLQLHVTVLRDDQNDFMGTVVVLDDLTQLMKAQRMAAWREVARRIAHEIKNPLTPIQLSAQRLRKRYLHYFDDEDSVFDECTSMIIKSVEEMKSLVNEFSNFARMPAVKPSRTSLNEILKESVLMFQGAHPGISFQFLPDEVVPELMLDRDQIKRVVINLLDNAVTALNGKGSISVASKYDRELSIANFTISDDGPGISPDARSRLFEPYFSTKKTGTGLGLAIVSSIITDHGGFVRVRSNSPSGACFVVELPVS